MEKLAAHARTLLRRGMIAAVASGGMIGAHAVAAGATMPAGVGKAPSAGTKTTSTTPKPDDGSEQQSTTATTSTTPEVETTTTSTVPETETTPGTSTTDDSSSTSSGESGSTPTDTGKSSSSSGRSLPTLPPPSRPLDGVSVTLRPAAGVVKVRLPKTAGFRSLPAGAQLPVVTVIDASAGKVVLTSAVNAKGATKSGTFTGGRFVVQQVKGPHPVTGLRLAGGSFAGCAATVTHARFAVRAVTRRRRPRVIRQLWGSDHGGSFVSIGRGASAAVRGTVWLTQDLCGGTLIT